ncbi:hypothetical protein MIND_00759800 [Mycena indigotica]|uniref:Uncharacterized protein n=1 Tax=Mycena indigotica TaxID=2126181 RepID=A0A8H6W1V5_9AGAR|nr:uncharacterized protein MIND_00759800 [Mycena indigotica]KAF7301937.1 hypothetical protein MIND_00759800 [Mycena indigotica]
MLQGVGTSSRAVTPPTRSRSRSPLSIAPDVFGPVGTKELQQKVQAVLEQRQETLGPLPPILLPQISPLQRRRQNQKPLPALQISTETLMAKFEAQIQPKLRTPTHEHALSARSHFATPLPVQMDSYQPTSEQLVVPMMQKSEELFVPMKRTSSELDWDIDGDGDAGPRKRRRAESMQTVVEEGPAIPGGATDPGRVQKLMRIRIREEKKRVARILWSNVTAARAQVHEQPRPQPTDSPYEEQPILSPEPEALSAPGLAGPGTPPPPTTTSPPPTTTGSLKRTELEWAWAWEVDPDAFMRIGKRPWVESMNTVAEGWPAEPAILVPGPDPWPAAADHECV